MELRLSCTEPSICCQMLPQLILFCVNCLHYINGLVQERHNSIADALELCLSCTIPSILYGLFLHVYFFIQIGEIPLFGIVVKSFSWISLIQINYQPLCCWVCLRKYKRIYHCRPHVCTAPRPLRPRHPHTDERQCVWWEAQLCVAWLPWSTMGEIFMLMVSFTPVVQQER